MTLDEVRALAPGLYVISWKDGGESPGTIYRDSMGITGFFVVDAATRPTGWSAVSAVTPVDVWNRRAQAYYGPHSDKKADAYRRGYVRAPPPWPPRAHDALLVLEPLAVAPSPG